MERRCDVTYSIICMVAGVFVLSFQTYNSDYPLGFLIKSFAFVAIPIAIILLLSNYFSLYLNGIITLVIVFAEEIIKYICATRYNETKYRGFVLASSFASWELIIVKASLFFFLGDGFNPLDMDLVFILLLTVSAFLMHVLTSILYARATFGTTLQLLIGFIIHAAFNYSRPIYLSSAEGLGTILILVETITLSLVILWLILSWRQIAL